MSQKKEVQEENYRRLDQLENLVEAHTRTERHLAQYSNIATKEQQEHAKAVQRKREKQIENIENIVVTGRHNNEYDE
ncbi:hypothetical protein EDC19_0023 [Natranaerovirga hydrolytica]|uniref:Protein Tlp homolog n=1 Tax=Natranaerovirga hydrolytica TaxID=680378 RepID=A0A4V6NFJ8_9FIRM|nr:hypothetical protein [Natranaerovirga hydrolytica]TCL00043.1 hypothetical protein EDC19_0023 [Natranaerovirga hydrolytica]